MFYHLHVICALDADRCFAQWKKAAVFTLILCFVLCEVGVNKTTFFKGQFFITQLFFELGENYFQYVMMTVYQLPTLSLLLHFSDGGRASPACSSSMEIPFGSLINAIWPSLGGRRMVTPASSSCSQS